jgi:FkbM family methyltransferase
MIRRLLRRGRDRRNQRASLEGVLRQAAGAGLSPATVIDIGAAYGHFAKACQAIFPHARFVLVEALEEYAGALHAVAAELPDAILVPAAAASTDGEITINVHDDLVGSSLYLEDEDSSVNGVPRTVAAVTLDTLLARERLPTPLMIKIDVQGAELDVLDGAAEALKQADYVMLEVSFFEFFKGGPMIEAVFAYMKQKGFVAYDVFGHQYRPLDGALSQVDIAFVPEAGALREHHFYATREQRAEQDASLKRVQKQNAGS